VFPDASSKVAVLAIVVNAFAPVYCLTYIGSFPPSAVAISAKPASAAVPPILIRKRSLLAMVPYTRSAESVPVTVLVACDAVAAVKAKELVTAFEEDIANELDTVNEEVVAKELDTVNDDVIANDEVVAKELDTVKELVTALDDDIAKEELTTFCIDDVAIGTATPVESPTQVNPCCIFGTSL
jgi:hypothetical protein